MIFSVKSGLRGVSARDIDILCYNRHSKLTWSCLLVVQTATAVAGVGGVDIVVAGVGRGVEGAGAGVGPGEGGAGGEGRGAALLSRRGLLVCNKHSSLSPPSPSSSCRAGWPHLSITRTMERLQDAGGEKGQASMMIYFGIFSSIMLRKNIVNILIFHDVKRQNCLSTKCTVQRYRQETPYFAIWTNNLK